MTGFSKRKKAKQTIRRNKAIEREKTALNQMRKQVSLLLSSLSHLHMTEILSLCCA